MANYGASITSSNIEIGCLKHNKELNIPATWPVWFASMTPYTIGTVPVYYPIAVESLLVLGPYYKREHRMLI